MLPILTNSDIRYAEKILFGKTRVFDQERIDFIKNLDTIDLQAVPGSGKTTALLAKLLILERYLPFKDNAGILVISHTNTAVDEIKDKIRKHCPKLFSYPNFVGTIQSFVDQFLAIPFYNRIRKKGHYRIDNEIYNERLEFLLNRCLPNQAMDTFRKVKHIYNSNPKLIHTYRFGINAENQTCLLKDIGGEQLEISKPKGRTKQQNYTDYSDQEKETVLRYLLLLKKEIMKSGVLCFDDAYFLAELYLLKIPLIKKVLQNRFKLVFIDEMQDMDTHQYNLLDKLFYKKYVQNHVFQRIGDKNQAIFSGNAKIATVWTDREKVLKLSGSQRLSPQIARIVKHFGLDYIDTIGRNVDKGIAPIILLFNDDTIEHVLAEFTRIISEHQSNGLMPSTLQKPVKAIGWSAMNDNEDKLGIMDYHSTYSKVTQGKRIDFPNLKAYIFGFDITKETLEPIRKNILNALLRVLRMENILHAERPFTKRTLLYLLKENFFVIYEEFNLKIFTWAIKLIAQDTEGLRNECAVYFRFLLSNVFGKNELSETTNSFLDNDEDYIPVIENRDTSPNQFIANGIELEIGSVHSVKGETHSATLYLETCYYRHETDKLKMQLIGNVVQPNDNKTTKEAAKMMYVGLSRPTSLLCYATHSNRVNNELKQQLIDNGWQIEEIEQNDLNNN